MTVTIINADMREALAGVPDQSVDCILTDPPYGETSLRWDKRVPDWPDTVRRVLKTTGSMWVFGSQRMFLETAGEFSKWRLVQDVVWEKHNGSGFAADRFKRVHELALQFYRDDAPWSGVYKLPQFTMDAVGRSVTRKAKGLTHTGGRGPYKYSSEDGGPRLMRSVIYARSEHGSSEHPTQKPLAIVEPLLLYACPLGGTVLDPFAGSGTTGVLANRHGMNAILIERDAAFIPIINSRLEGDAPLFSEIEGVRS